jgi:cobyrinic acid a,c-diamide synthase
VSAVYLSAAHKSCGKTLIGIGLSAAFSAQGKSVSTFKKGPDYIDSGWLGVASGSPCRNLDFHTQSNDEIVASFTAATTDVRLVEGTKGLHDGVAADGSDSNAAMALLLGTPVVLVLDTRGMTRGVASLARGLVEFDPCIQVVGVIFNRVGGARHQAKLVAAIQTYTDLEVFGSVGEDATLGIEQRHLGLTTAVESDGGAFGVAALGRRVAAEVNVDRLAALGSATHLPAPRDVVLAGKKNDRPVRIGVARDRAFCFYYAGDLEAMEREGAQLEFFDTLNDERLPDVDGLFIGGGFPETQAHALDANHQMRGAVCDAARRGMPIYAECGGLMYLARDVTWRDQRASMCGVLPFGIEVGERPVGRGYMRLRETGNAPWGPIARNGAREVNAHEFHYSQVVGAPRNLEFAYEVSRGFGVDGANDGIVHGSVFASYAHLRHTDATPWAQNFVNWVRTSAAAVDMNDASTDSATPEPIGH